MEEMTYPMRINRYLALKNYCSRREADAMIAKGLVLINKKIAKLGDKVEEKDLVELKKGGEDFKKYVYFAYNKPKGIVTSLAKEGQKSIEQIAFFAKDVFPVGRLDKSSRGLIIMTNDGRINDKLLNPSKAHEKEYIVKVNKPLSNLFFKHMRQGIQLEDFKTRPATVEKVDDSTFSIILTEGKKHQIRRMCAAVGFSIFDLKRSRIMNVQLGELGSGQQRKIEGEELSTLLKSLGI